MRNFKLALFVFVGLIPYCHGPALAGPYPSSLKDHGHTASGDGGRLTNLTISNVLTSTGILTNGATTGTLVINNRISGTGLSLSTVAFSSSVVNNMTAVTLTANNLTFTGPTLNLNPNDLDVDTQITFGNNSGTKLRMGFEETIGSGQFYLNYASALGAQNALLRGYDLVGGSYGMEVRGNDVGTEATAGYYGEYLSSSTLNKSFPATGVYGDLVSLQLSPGDWDLTFCQSSQANGATVPRVYWGISNTSGNTTTGLVEGNNLLDSIPGPVAGASNAGGCISNFRVLTNTTTTYYGKYRGDFTVAVPNMQGILKARRQR